MECSRFRISLALLTIAVQTPVAELAVIGFSGQSSAMTRNYSDYLVSNSDKELSQVKRHFTFGPCSPFSSTVQVYVVFVVGLTMDR